MHSYFSEWNGLTVHLESMLMTCTLPEAHMIFEMCKDCAKSVKTIRKVPLACNFFGKLRNSHQPTKKQWQGIKCTDRTKSLSLSNVILKIRNFFLLLNVTCFSDFTAFFHLQKLVSSAISHGPLKEWKEYLLRVKVNIPKLPRFRAF